MEDIIVAERLKISMDIKEIDWQVLYDNFDSRDGFQTIVFGLDYHEECELLKQLSQALNFDLSFIKYPEGKAWGNKSLVCIWSIKPCKNKLQDLFLCKKYKTKRKGKDKNMSINNDFEIYQRSKEFIWTDAYMLHYWIKKGTPSLDLIYPKIQ